MSVFDSSGNTQTLAGAKPEFRSLPNLPENFGNDWLSNAEEILLPEAIRFMPQTAAWWWLLVLLFLVLACVGYSLWQMRQRTLYVRQAQQQLQLLREQLGQGEPEALATVPHLLKRVAFSCWSRTDLVPLGSEQWMRFWSSTAEEEPPPLIKTVAYLDAHSLAAIAPHDRLALFAWAERWISQHRRYRLNTISTLLGSDENLLSATDPKAIRGEAA